MAQIKGFSSVWTVPRKILLQPTCVVYDRWYSRCCFQIAGQELIDGLKVCFVSALRKYHEENHQLPDKIIVFRDGVGDGQLPIVQNYEVKQLQVCVTPLCHFNVFFCHG